jgi:hypothetical protein
VEGSGVADCMLKAASHISRWESLCNQKACSLIVSTGCDLIRTEVSGVTPTADPIILNLLEVVLVGAIAKVVASISHY